MKIWDVIKELEEDPNKLFMVSDYNYWGTEYEAQIPHALITMNHGKCVFYNGEIVKLGYAVLNCYYKPVKGNNKFSKNNIKEDFKHEK